MYHTQNILGGWEIVDKLKGESRERNRGRSRKQISNRIARSLRVKLQLRVREALQKNGGNDERNTQTSQPLPRDRASGVLLERGVNVNVRGGGFFKEG